MITHILRTHVIPIPTDSLSDRPLDSWSPRGELENTLGDAANFAHFALDKVAIFAIIQKYLQLT